MLYPLQSNTVRAIPVDEHSEIWDILKKWFDTIHDLNELPSMLEEIYQKKWVKINTTKLSEFKQDIDLLEDDTVIYEDGVEIFTCNSYYAQQQVPENINYWGWDEIGLKIRYNLLIRFGQLIYELFPNEHIEVISSCIQNHTAYILWNPNIKDEVSFLTKSSYYNIDQTIDWDLIITKFPAFSHMDMFKIWKKDSDSLGYVDNSTSEMLHIFQYPDQLFEILLRYCFVNKYYPNELVQLMDTSWDIPNAWNALDVRALNTFESDLKSKQIKSISVGRNVAQNGLTHYGDILNNKIIITSYDTKKEVYWKTFNIKQDDIWPLLMALRQKPGRSYNEMTVCYQIFKDVVWI